MDKSAIDYYCREDIQKAILETVKDREVAVKFGDKGFGKRPDILRYPQDVAELAKQGATSFHVSEERWDNPLNLDPRLKKSEIDKMRIGWDLVLDIDCKYFEYSKLAADLVVKALQHHGVKNVTVKFSGNLGFHIGVPFESFPYKIFGQQENEIRELFPDAPRKIAYYLTEMIREPLANAILEKEDIKKIIKKTGKNFSDLVKENKFDPFSILSIDTVLIASRHLYRSIYSLNEKSGLASVPIEPDKILEFEKEYANPEKINVNNHKFLTEYKKDEAKQLIIQALDYSVKHEVDFKKEDEGIKEYEEIKEAIPAQFFAPCIKNILAGIDDGKKRSLFILVNYLNSIGWNYDNIQKLLEEWNKKNKEQLKETIIIGQTRYHKQQKKKILPPNCMNSQYYKDFHVCTPDNLCLKIKNPVNYSVRKAKYHKNIPKKKDVT
ncbi:MAG: hypothetical protein V1740_08320 [Candidatus Woesearchaeota archaeon]